MSIDDKLKTVKKLIHSASLYCYWCNDPINVYSDYVEGDNTQCSHCENAQADQYDKFPFCNKDCNNYLDVEKAKKELDKNK